MQSENQIDAETVSAKSQETRRRFVERLAKIAVVPLVQPLMLTLSSTASLGAS